MQSENARCGWDSVGRLSGGPKDRSLNYFVVPPSDTTSCDVTEIRPPPSQQSAGETVPACRRFPNLRVRISLVTIQVH